MKLTLFLFILTISQLWATETYSQMTKLDLKLENVKISDALKEIENRSEFFFLYSPKLIDVERKVNIVADKESIKDVLSNIFDEKVKFVVYDRQIILSPIEHSEVLSAFQQHSITGTVTDKDGAPLAGVNVVITGTTIGTMTDFNGKFSIEVSSESKSLTFSFIGMKSMDINIGTLTQINVTLGESSIGLDEVVVVGYGTQSSRHITGSLTRVDMVKTQNLPNSNITQSLRGRVAGVQFTENGRPGQNGSILIRGPRSLTAGNNPLIVVDGIIFNGNLTDINPNDVESMNVLKDASSAAIYGSRAANGVILITSKIGSSEKPTIHVNAFSGISDWSYKVKLLSPERYLQKTVDVRNQNGVPSDMDHIRDYLTTSELVNYDAGITTDPYDAISQKGGINSFDMNLSGKTNSTNYFLSGSFDDERGLIYNDNLKRLTFRANIENKINKWLSIGLNATYINRNTSGRVAAISSAYSATPYGTWYYPDGLPTEYVILEDQIPANAMRPSLLTQDEKMYSSLFANFYVLVDIPFIKGLKYRFNISPNDRWQHSYNAVKQDIHIPTVNNTSAYKFNQEDFDLVLENILSYSKQFNPNNAIDLTLLYGLNNNFYESTTANSLKLSSDVLGWNDLNLGETLTNSSKASSSNGISSMFRMNYRFMEKYLFTFTIRRDGSSVFAANNKFATFPSVGLAWIASDEKFLKNISFLDQLKFRFSYGAVGNQAISPYQSLSLSSTNRYVFGDGGASSLGVFPSNMSNTNLKWETTYTSDAAVDFALFKGRLGGTFEVYYMDTKDLLVKRSLPSMTGYSFVMTNLGETTNKGLEVTLNTVNVKKSKFEWSTDIILSKNVNKIVHLYYSDANSDGKEDDDIINNWFIGQPVNVAYDYVFNGIYQAGDVLPSGYKPGYVRLADLNEDGKIDADDRKVLGQTSEPKYRWGLTNTFQYGDISLSVFVNAMQGWMNSILSADYSVSGGNYPHRPLNQLDAGWWTSENKFNTRESLVYPNPYGIKYYWSRDFIRIQDVSLTYELPKNLAHKVKLSNLRITLSGKNLFTSTKWIGPDPETGYNSSGSFYPTAKSLNMGINFGF